MKHEVAVELTGGKRLVFETGRIAKQASGAAFVTLGESVVLATAVASPDREPSLRGAVCIYPTVPALLRSSAGHAPSFRRHVQSI